MKRFKFISILLVSLICILGFQSIVKADQIPDTAPKYYVYDPEHYLDRKVIQKVKEINSKYRDSELRPQIAIAIVESLDGDIESIARETASKWKVGFSDTNAGMLVLIDVNGHKIRTELSETLRSKLSSYDTESLNDSVKNDFRNEDYSAGMMNYLNELDSKLDQIVNPSSITDLVTNEKLDQFSTNLNSALIAIGIGVSFIVILTFSFKLIRIRRYSGSRWFEEDLKVADKQNHSTVRTNQKLLDYLEEEQKKLDAMRARKSDDREESRKSNERSRDNDELMRTVLIASTLNAASHSSDSSSYSTPSHSTPSYTHDSSSWTGGGFDGGGSTGSW